MTQLIQLVTPADMVKITSTIAFIQEAHQGQKYGNMPYFYHPIEVADTVKWATVDEYLAALLHDVVEDTDYTAEDLLERFSPEVVAMVVLLTKDESMDYQANIERIIKSENLGAMRVKLADNLVNSRGDKSAMTKARAKKLNDRYAMSIEMLTSALGDEAFE